MTTVVPWRSTRWARRRPSRRVPGRWRGAPAAQAAINGGAVHGVRARRRSTVLEQQAHALGSSSAIAAARAAPARHVPLQAVPLCSSRRRSGLHWRRSPPRQRREPLAIDGQQAGPASRTWPRSRRQPRARRGAAACCPRCPPGRCLPVGQQGSARPRASAGCRGWRRQCRQSIVLSVHIGTAGDQGAQQLRHRQAAARREPGRCADRARAAARRVGVGARPRAAQASSTCPRWRAAAASRQVRCCPGALAGGSSGVGTGCSAAMGREVGPGARHSGCDGVTTPCASGSNSAPAGQASRKNSWGDCGGGTSQGRAANAAMSRHRPEGKPWVKNSSCSPLSC